MKRIDLTLLVIASANPPALQPAQLQKAVFLITKNLSLRDLGFEEVYSFVAYDYGPFCRDIYLDAEALERQGLVAIQRPPESRYKLYTVTDAGARHAHELSGRLPGEVMDYVRRVVQFTQGLSFNELVGVIYRDYPEMSVNSVFRE